MQAPVNLLQYALSELFATANTTGCLTLADRYGLMAAMFDESLPEDERRAIDRLLRSVSRGRIKVVNELSMLQSI
ncbi:MAG: hypothetical protein HC825_02575 [Oscillatoriales cyanobacterium RM1_1_9]|nr:hypothetical protein [Oscillatoriales cyanobacterium SM2_3_0]NJO44265.1 hypothetical protein [Oscillatoriales cyanobacterium RM2_1_1]NJO70876.1 hypothetical protein [Oscillatoriales cyanobacterium RM1_1_9]